MATPRKAGSSSARSRNPGGRPRPERSRGTPPAPKTPVPAPAAEESSGLLMPLAGELRSWADSVLGLASSAADLSLNVAKMRLRSPAQRAALSRAGALLRTMRESAGLSLKDLGAAINLRDPALLEAAEGGKVALPFEMILRLASVLGQNDPFTFVMRFTRTQSPDLWKTLEHLGIGRLVLQAGREREFANIYRANNAARRLTDEEFADVLAFVRSAFELAIRYHRKHAKT